MTKQSPSVWPFAVAGERFDTSVRHFDLSGRQLGDMQELAALRSCPELSSASFASSNLNDEGLAYVARAEALEVLDLQSTEVTEQGLASLNQLPRLVSLRLKENDQLGNGAVLHLVRLTQLTDLGIHETSIDQRGLEQLTVMSQLRDLCLYADGRNYSFEGVRRISIAMPECRILVKGHGEFLAGQFDGDSTSW